MSEKPSQFSIKGLAARRYWTLFNDWMNPFVKQCEDIAKEVNPELWYQYEEGLVTGSEFVNKLVNDLYEGEQEEKMACSALLEKANHFCRNFVTGLEDFMAKICPVEMRDFKNKCCGAFTLANTVGNKLNEDSVKDKIS